MLRHENRMAVIGCLSPIMFWLLVEPLPHYLLGMSADKRPAVLLKLQQLELAKGEGAPEIIGLELEQGIAVAHDVGPHTNTCKNTAL